MPFELSRFGLPNIAAIVALALVPLIALPMHSHRGATKTQKVAMIDTEQHAAAVTYDIAD